MSPAGLGRTRHPPARVPGNRNDPGGALPSGRYETVAMYSDYAKVETDTSGQEHAMTRRGQQ